MSEHSPAAVLPEDDRPIDYMRRTREYYLALGYGNPYVWAHYSEVPFAPLQKPLADTTLTLLTTAAPYQPDKGPQGPGAPYNAAAKFYRVYSSDTAQDHDLRVSHVGIDRKHTNMEDANCWFPLPALRRAVAVGRLGRLAPRFHGVPTNRSQRTTLDVDLPEVVARCLADGVEAAILVPNCPICHQTLSLAARALEAVGIATVVAGCAKDVVEHCGVPRFLFSDFPLGNGTGKPHDPTSQDVTLELAMRVLESAPAPRTTVQSPLRWAADAAWKQDFSNVARLSPDEIVRLRTESDRAKDTASDIRAHALNSARQAEERGA